MLMRIVKDGEEMQYRLDAKTVEISGTGNVLVDDIMIAHLGDVVMMQYNVGDGWYDCDGITFEDDRPSDIFWDKSLDNYSPTEYEVGEDADYLLGTVSVYAGLL